MEPDSTNRKKFGRSAVPILTLGALGVTALLAAAALQNATPLLHASDESTPAKLLSQAQEDADRKSAGCISCHTQTDQPTMHTTGTVRLGCTDCHGGNADVRIASGTSATSPEYEQAKRQAHPQPRDPKLADRSAN